MKKLLTLLIAATVCSAAAQDKKGCETAEPSYMTRMPGFFIRNCESSEFKTVHFKYQAEKGKTTEKVVSGMYRHISYEKIKAEPRAFSGDQIRNNYANAVRKVKGDVMSIRNDFFKLSVEGGNVYFKVDNAEDTDDKGFDLFIVEEAAMKQDVEISLKEVIDRDGKATLYGILFDVNKATIQPESATALQTIVEYLNTNPSVRIIVVGHTDNTGNPSGNLQLSNDRARAVKGYLINTGKIDVTRIEVAGVGSWCPVSTNDTDKGRSLNRRVEIVKQ